PPPVDGRREHVTLPGAVVTGDVGGGDRLEGRGFRCGGHRQHLVVGGVFVLAEAVPLHLPRPGGTAVEHHAGGKEGDLPGSGRGRIGGLHLTCGGRKVDVRPTGGRVHGQR